MKVDAPVVPSPKQSPYDSIRIPLLPPDSLLSDSLKKAKADSTKDSDLDTTVYYYASDVRLNAKEKKTVLTGNAKVVYKTMELRAHRIVVDWENNELHAEGRNDTLWMDTTATAVDTIMLVDTPLFLDRSSGSTDSLRGEQMEMNIKTQRGRVFFGRTAYDQGRYRGDIMKRVEPEVMYIRDGTFTSCDNPEPHFHFAASKLKMIYKDKLVAQPVVLYFGQIPTAIIPYGVFSLRPGRHSGLIMPAYGESSGQGRYLQHLGYYWAPTDYYDSKATVDYYERTGTVWRMENNYALRYKLTGSLSGSIVKKRPTDRWDMTWAHSQIFDPVTSLQANMYYASDQSIVRDYTTNAMQRLQQDISSGIAFRTSWPGTRASLSAGLTYRQNISTPRIQFELARSFISIGAMARSIPRRRKMSSVDSVARRVNRPMK